MIIKKHKNGSVTVTLVSENEKTMMGNLFNCTPFLDAIRKSFPECPEYIYADFEAAGCKVSGKTSELADNLLATLWFQSKKKAMLESFGEKVRAQIWQTLREVKL